MFPIIILLSIIGLISTDLFVPSLPNIAHLFHESQNHTQILISLFLASFGLSQLFYGPISDRTGRKPPILIGMFIFIIASIICLESTSFYWLCVGRILQGVGVGAGIPLARIILRDRHHGTQLAIHSAKLAIFVALSPAIAPFLGGILQQAFGYRGSFIFMLCYGLILFTLVLFFLKETNQTKNNSISFSHVTTEYRSILKNYYFIRYAIISGFSYASIILFANMIPFIAQNQLNLSAAQSGEIILLGVLGMSLGSFTSSKLVDKMGSAPLIKIALQISTLSGLLIFIFYYFFGTTLICLIPCIFLITMTCGFIFPNASALSFSHIKSNIGIAGAVYGSLQVFTAMAMNLILNVVTHQNQELLGVLYFSIGIASLLLLSSKKTNRLQEYKIKKLTKVIKNRFMKAPAANYESTCS